MAHLAEAKKTSKTQADISADSKDASLGADPKFLVGVAVSVYQNSGAHCSVTLSMLRDPYNETNWGWFEDQKKVRTGIRLRLGLGGTDDADGLEENHDEFVEARWDDLGPSVIEGGFKIGVASDFWNRYEEDIMLAKGLGSNAFRISIEWARIVPQRGVIDEEAVKHYHRMFDQIDACGMEVNVTVHWFVHPLWFQDIGAFTKEENIEVFVEWAKLAFTLFGKRSKLWSTFNEPGVAAMCGFITGNHPPGHYMDFKGAGTTLMNMLRSHGAAYKALKAMPGAEDVDVGIVHNVFWLEPKGKGPLYFHVRAVLKACNRIWGNEVVIEYLKTGKFHAWSPFGPDIRFQEPNGRPGCDWFGVNHYARAVVDWKMQPATKGEKGSPTDMGYPVYPPSLYRSISYASTLGLPIYITENGIPAAADDPNRAKWINGCLDVVEAAVKDGYDVRGFFYWTLIDNFEWNFAWELKFGLYEWIPDGRPGGGRHMKKGSEVIQQWFLEMPDKLSKLLAARDAAGLPVKSDEERERLERRHEKEFLRSQGDYTEEELEDFLPQKQPQVNEAETGLAYQERQDYSLL